MTAVNVAVRVDASTDVDRPPGVSVTLYPVTTADPLSASGACQVSVTVCPTTLAARALGASGAGVGRNHVLRKPKAAETAPAAGVSRFRGMSEDQLLNELAAYINNGGGLWYARTVLEKAGVDSLDDLTAEQMIDALENPNKFKQQPAA